MQERTRYLLPDLLSVVLTQKLLVTLTNIFDKEYWNYFKAGSEDKGL